MVQETLFVGKQSFELDEAASTNNYAAQLLQSSIVKDGAVISALYQTEGKGQRNNTWKSEKGLNLLLSYVFFPTFLPVKEQFMLSVCVANAIAAFIAEVTQFQSFVKWPNDIFVHDKKIAGILIENSLKGSQIVSAIVGIGVNVNQNDFEDLKHATSLRLLCNKKFELNDLKNLLSSFLEASYLKLRSGKYLELLNAYNNKLYRKDNWQKFISNDETSEFKIIEVENDGRLCALSRLGEIQYLDFGNYRMQV